MTSLRRMPAYAIYQSQSPKNTTDNNSDANGTAESSAKRRKIKGKSQNMAAKKTRLIKKEPKLEEEASVISPPKTRGRKKKPVIVEEEISDAESENQSESSGERSDEHCGNCKTEVSEVVPWAENSRLTSKAYSCGTEAAEDVFNWLLHPIPPSHFFSKIFERGPHYHIRENDFNYYGGLFSSKDFDKIIKENRLEYNKEIDIVAYIDRERKPLVNGTIVYPDFVWDSYNSGYSVRMRNPQAYHQPLWQLCSLLQEYFSSCVGANMYLTPAGSQGFPPHWDDIDAFILQIEGKKSWKVYSPRNPKEEFPQLSSPDLDEATIGEPILEMEIKAGDMLYIPRGYIHQAHTTDAYSLHITISTNQQNTWSDFLHHGIEAALEKATEENVELRKSIPKDFFDFAGCTMPQTDSSLDTKERYAFRNKAQQLVRDVLNHFTVDAAADVHGAHFIHGCMRPFFNKQEGMNSIHWNGNKFQRGSVRKISSLTLDSKVRWIRKRAFRLVMDEEGPKLFHTLANGKNFKEFDTGFLEVDETAVPAVCALFQKHPEFIKVRDLPVQGNLAAKREFAEILYYNGFLMTEKPLPKEEEE